MSEITEIAKGIQICDLALYLKDSKTLVLSDFHIGYEEALNKQGVMLPRLQFKKTRERLKGLFAQLRRNMMWISHIIINGDLKHEFGEISKQEWDETIKIFDLLQKHCKKITLLKGNHDTVLEPIANKRGLTVLENEQINNILVTHGNKIPVNLNADIIIIAHEHPAVVISDKISGEKVKCFLKGKWNNKTLIVMPSFNLVIEGTNILSEKLLSPFLQNNRKFNDFECWAVPEFNKVMYFGKVKNLI